MNREQLKQAFARLLADGQTWIGVFQKRDPNCNLFGQRIASSFKDSEVSNPVVGISSLEDCRPGHGKGWILIAQARTVEEALAAFKGETTDVDLV
jgi:hypothetical protein